jgi:histidinol-phosphate aminotransferase
VVLQTLSKAWGLAALRVGMAFASSDIIGIMNKVKPPYNISQAAQELAAEALDEVGQVNDMIKILVQQREWLREALLQLPVTEYIYPSDANFLLVKTTHAREIYNYLLGKGIVLRDRSKTLLCDGCLRITIGTETENRQLIQALQGFSI